MSQKKSNPNREDMKVEARPTFEGMLRESTEEFFHGNEVKEIMREQLHKTVKKMIESMFAVYSEPYKKLQSEIEKRLIAQISKYNFDKYVPSIDALLTEVLASGELMDNKKAVENFRSLIGPKSEFTLPKSISDLFEAYKKFVAKEASTLEFEVDYDEEQYEPAHVSVDVDEVEMRSTYYTYKVLSFKCEEDSALDVDFLICQWEGDKYWTIDYKVEPKLTSIRGLNDFQIYLIRSMQAHARLEEDIVGYEEDEVRLEETPCLD